MTPTTAATVTVGQTIKLIPANGNQSVLVTGTCAQLYDPSQSGNMLMRWQQTDGTYVTAFRHITNLST
jgi:hypothetical protein